MLVTLNKHSKSVIEDLVSAHLGALFPGIEVLEHHLFRVTRNADTALETGEIDDLLETIEERLLRRRFGEVVRLETHPDVAPDVKARLQRELGLSDDDVYEVEGPLAPAGLMSLYERGPGRLKEQPWTPVRPALLPASDDADALFARMRAKDVLVHHPYESFDESVAALIETSASDPKVVGIKTTIYRTPTHRSARS